MSSKNPSFGGLTEKQFRFVQAYVLGQPDCPQAIGSASQSYRVAYDCENMATNSVYVEGCRMMDNPKIAQAIYTEQEKIKNRNKLSAMQIKDRAISQLLHESTCANSDASRVRATELLLRLEGVNGFGADKVETSQKLTIEQTEDQLMESIASALNDERVTALFNNKKSDN